MSPIENIFGAANLDSPSWISHPLSWIYGAGRVLDRSRYTLGVRARRRLPRPVICVGNLTVGGTGKTPFLIHVVGRLRRLGWRPVILSRGYGARPPAVEPRMVSDGRRGLCSVDRAGDESAMIALACEGVPVIIGADRYEAGIQAVERFDPDVFVLDDGFQHDALQRDVDLVLWDLRDSPSRTRLLPAGRLREGLGALRRATAIILTHGEYVPEAERVDRSNQALVDLKRAAPRVPVFEAETLLGLCRHLDRDDGTEQPEFPVKQLRGQRILLLSGLARPDGFEVMVRSAGLDVVGHLRSADHAHYSPSTLTWIASAIEREGADRVLTTEKDAVKLEGLKIGDLPLTAVGLSMRMKEPERWEPFLSASLPSPSGNQSHD